jgi:hypothetical protein
MSAPTSIFLDFNLPNSTTWLYFSFLLAMALFYKFSRVFSMRSWDVLTLFLLVPGFLLIQEAQPGSRPLDKNPAVRYAALVAAGGGDFGLGGSAGPNALGALAQATQPISSSPRLLWLGYLWLLCGSAYFFLRCLIDLVLVQRPALGPNLNFAGLAWLAGALFVCLSAVALRPLQEQAERKPLSNQVKTPLPDPSGTVAKEPQALALAKTTFEPLELVTRSFAMFCHLAVVVGLIVIGFRHFQDGSAGMAAATFYLMLPYTGLHVGQVLHVWPMVLVVWAVAAYRRPLLAGVLLGLAAGTVYFPVLIFPIWLSFYWRRGAGRFVAAFCLSATLCLATIFWLSGDLAGPIREALSSTAWQPWKVPTTDGFWTGVHWAYRIPVFIVYAAFVLATACWPAPKNLAHVLALSAAVFIGIQFWFADHGGVYVLWYLPLLLLLVFRPNLSDRLPAPIHPEVDWLSRLRSRLFRRRPKLKPPEPVVTGR